MAKCRVCRENESEWAWQPFGPSDSPDSFMFPGWFYRGFVVVKVCDSCKKQFQNGSPLVFKYKYVLYRITKTTRERHDLEKSWAIL